MTNPVIPEDATEGLWRTCYASIFNPARQMVDAMTSKMPRKYWKNLPEADLIPGLNRSANARAAAMQAALPSEPSPRLLARAKTMVAQALPEVPTEGIAGVRAAAGCCTRCPLHSAATQVVVFVTVHPSFILRLPDPALQEAERARYRDDLRIVAEMVRTMARA